MGQIWIKHTKNIKMHIFVRCIIASLVVVELITAQSSLKAARDPRDIHLPVYNECGGVVSLTHEHWLSSNCKIEYKYGGNYDTDEFCVWTVLPHDNLESITLTFKAKTSLGNSDDGIIVYAWESNILRSYRIVNNATSTLTLKSTLLFISFTSVEKSSPREGFQITLSTNKVVFGVTSRRAYFSDNVKGSLTYPRIEGETQYGRNERTSIVLHGPHQSPRPFSRYILKNMDVDDNGDFVTVFLLLPYNSYYAPYYRQLGKFSGHIEGTVENSTVITPYPLLFLFSSDDKVSKKGFTIEWAPMQRKIIV